MRTYGGFVIALAGMLLIAMPVTAQFDAPPGGFNQNMEYTGGPNVCRECHEKAFEDWVAHGHSGKLSMGMMFQGSNNPNPGAYGQKENARYSGVPLPLHDPDVYNWDNILFIVGATKYWKTRFVGNDGYFLTVNGLNQYNWATGEWVDYNKDVVMKPFDCGTCHTTGYDLDGTAFQDGTASEDPVPGIIGDFSHINITCEACHGPGAEHVAAAAAMISGDVDNMVVGVTDSIISGEDITAADCGECHTRGDDNNVVLASGGFIRHHEQYPEMLAGAHSFFDAAFGGCGACHYSHVGRAAGIGLGDSQTCEDCHPTEAADYDGSSMYEAKVTCIDCHMGLATKSARAAGQYEGDVWTHLFRIDTGADYDMFNRDGEGNTVSAKGALSLEFACFRCHADADKADYSAIEDYHTLGK